MINILSEIQVTLWNKKKRKAGKDSNLMKLGKWRKEGLVWKAGINIIVRLYESGINVSS